jgi:hypothetical protein
MYEAKVLQAIIGLSQDKTVLGDKFRLRVATSSMLPLLAPGDEITVKRLSLDELRFSDIVVYTKRDELYVHRLLLKGKCQGERYFIATADRGFRFEDRLAQESLLGKVITVHKPDRNIDLGLCSSRIKGLLSAVVSAYIGLVYESLRWMKKIILRVV